MLAAKLHLPVLLLMLSSTVVPAAETPPSNRLVVHEWGTFTTLCDHDGRQLPGINIDDEPLPKFVHNLQPFVLASAQSLRQISMKGAPQRHPYVTVRLETPVIYFYPPAAAKLPLELDVRVALHGGWLTEFYPSATADAPGLALGQFRFGRITEDTVGRLAWSRLRVGELGEGPKTDEHVWLAPRKVQAATVATESGEYEKYLFYRGVGNFDAPLRVAGASEKGSLRVYGNFDELLQPAESLKIPAAWLVHVRQDGKAAFQGIAPLVATADDDHCMAELNCKFEEEQFSTDALDRLQAEMYQALVADGLFADEATALLSTWQRAYFKSPGMRLFYLVPQKWTDRQMPLSISQPADVTRVMVGRVELISPEQRSLLDRLGRMQVSNPGWMGKLWDTPHAEQLREGRIPIGDLGVDVPADYQAYLALGRFRNALVVAEERRRPTSNLPAFVDAYELQAFRVTDEVPAAKSEVADKDEP